MKLSVVIPILNEEARLKDLLPELCKREEQDIELIIVDTKNSCDDSASICSQHEVIYHKESCVGRAAQMNFGAQKSSGDVIMFLHADVLPPLGFYNEIKEAINNGNQMGFFAYDFLPTNKWLSINASFTEKDGLFAGGGDQCQFISRDTFEKLGGFDEYFVIMEDFDLMRRVRKNKIPYSIIPKRATVSSRKYAKNSYLKVNAVNFFVFMLFKLRVKPESLQKIYKTVLAS